MQPHAKEQEIRMMKEKIIFMGTPDIAASVMQRMLDAGINITLAVTQPDKKVGRKQVVQPSAVKALAQTYGIDVFQPVSIKKDYQRILDEDADLIVTIAYGQIVPQAVLDAPHITCVNLHGSLLPEYRGAAPIQRAIWDGNVISGMSLMEMEAGMDTGGVLDTMEVVIEPDDNSTTLFEKMGDAAGELIVKNMDLLLSGEARFIAQDHEKATYAPMISKEEEKIDFSKDDQQIVNQIRALALQPGAYGLVSGKKLKILEGQYVPGEPQQLQVLEAEGKKGMSIGLHNGKYVLHKVQMEGKPVMNIKDFMNGQGRNMIGKKVE